MVVWLKFFGLALIVGVAGYQLSYFAEIISQQTGLARNWIGLVLLATITSLPELISGVASIRFVDGPDLAVGNILGSCLYNLMLIVVLELFHRQGSIYEKTTQGHLLSAALGMVLVAFVGFSMATTGRVKYFAVGHVELSAIGIPILYLIAMRIIYVFEKTHAEPLVVALKGKYTTRQASLYFGLAALVVLGAGMGLPRVAMQIVEQMGWNEAFVGTAFLAFATTIPEVTVTLSAIRLGVIELAISNVLGSILFNVIILGIDDLLYTRGALFQAIQTGHQVTAFSVLMMTGLVMIGMLQRPVKRIFKVMSVLSLLLLGVYSFNMFLIFQLGSAS